MPANSPDTPPPAKPTGLWARLRNALTGTEPKPEADLLPTFDVPLPEPEPPAVTPVDEPIAAPLAEPLGETFDVLPNAEAEPVSEEELAAATAGDAEAPPQFCPACSAQRIGQAQFCNDCGYMYPARGTAVSAVIPASRGAAESAVPHLPTWGTAVSAIARAGWGIPDGRLNDRYEVVELLGERGEVRRFKAIDHGGNASQSVVLLQTQSPSLTLPAQNPMPESPFELDVELDHPPEEEVRIGQEADATAASDQISPQWPSMEWEARLLAQVLHPAWPRIVERFSASGMDYVVEASKPGRAFWDAWEDPAFDHVQKFNWLAEIAEALRALHDAGAILESLRPEMLVLTEENRPAFAGLGSVLPLPLPAEVPLEGNFYTAPELILAPESADARADLYTFGAMLYSLYLGRELGDMDFERQGVPKAFVLQFPDVHPALARILMKTFVRDVEMRFPTEEAAQADATGFAELIRVLRSVGRLMTQVRLDAAGWTTTGMVRTNNEDAFAILQSVGSTQDDLGERLLAILADGMGGYEAGEVAAAMAIDSIREQLSFVIGPLSLVPSPSSFASPQQPKTNDQGQMTHDKGQITDLLVSILRETNRVVFTASRTPGVGKRGMGCTAEVAFISGRKLYVGHVGDSRTYHYTAGRVIQLTKDQTLVNRLVELGQLTAEEAEDHPRKNELQQAIGGQPVVDPLAYEAELSPGDWVLICSDGLTGHVNHETLTEMIQRADSAEMLARRLCNLANLYGGTDNCTVIAIRVT